MDSVKVEVPQFVNEWFLKNVNKNGLYELVKKLIWKLHILGVNSKLTLTKAINLYEKNTLRGVK